MSNAIKPKTERTGDAAEIVARDLGIAGNATRRRSVADETEKLEIAEKVYAIRESLGLSVRKFGQLVGLAETAVSRLERADYAGMPGVRTLDKIARASGYRLRVDFVSVLPNGRIAYVRPKTKRTNAGSKAAATSRPLPATSRSRELKAPTSTSTKRGTSRKLKTSA